MGSLFFAFFGENLANVNVNKGVPWLRLSPRDSGKTTLNVRFKSVTNQKKRVYIMYGRKFQ